MLYTMYICAELLLSRLPVLVYASVDVKLLLHQLQVPAYRSVEGLYEPLVYDGKRTATTRGG